jgi:hypothetical protein
MSSHALMSLFYNDSKQRGQRGETGYARWARKANAAELGSLSAILGRIQSPKGALETLRRTPHENPNLEAAVVAASYWGNRSDRGGDGKMRGEYGAHLESLLGDTDLVNAIDGALSREKASAFAYGVPDTEWQFTEVDVDRDGVTRVGAEGTVPRGTQGFPFYAQLADPRNWSKFSTSSFRDSYGVEQRPANAFEDPEPITFPAGGGPGYTWKKGLLFEFARMEVSSFGDLTEFRNLVNIDFTVAAASADLSYALEESLTSSVIGIKNGGGIDVDFGNGGVSFVTDDVAGVATEKLAVYGLKCLRFSKAAAYSEELNVMVLPFLLLWIPAMILEAPKT